MRPDRSPAGSLLHIIKPSLEIGLRDLADGCEHAQDIEETRGVVVALQWADGVAFGQSGGDGGRD
jgi:hypothetical protein